MPPQTQLPRVVRFGTFEVDVPAGELRKNGMKVKLQAQPFQVLCMLVERPGEVVTREELRSRLWPGDTFGDFDHGLNAAVKRLRDALGDDPDNPRFVATLARRGYRFIASVEGRPSEPRAQPLPTSVTPTPMKGTGRGFRPAYLLGVAGITAVILALVVLLNGVGGNRWRLGLGGKQIESLAVLPLENLSGDPQQEYFSDGMTDALIADLSKIGTLQVASRTSSMRYKKASKTLLEIGRELNVDGVVEGSIMRSGNRVRITVQLIRVSTDQHLWGETYERDLSDVLKLQGDVAQAVAQQVRAQVTPEQQARLRSAPAVNPEAYESYLRGSSLLRSDTGATLRHAQAYFEEAVRRDPRFAPAYVGLADCYLELGSYRWIPPQDASRYGSEAIHKALQIDETLGDAHSSLGFLDWQYGWDWQTAEKEMRYAVDLNPNYVEGHITLVWYLAWSGRRDEALAESQKIRSLDPAYPLASFDESAVYYHQRGYKSLMEVSQRSVITNPNSWSGHYFLAVGYEGSGQLAQAIPEYQRAVELSQRDSDPTAGLAYAYATLNKKAEAKKILGDLQRQSETSYVSPYMIAVIYAGLGENNKAFEFLEKAYQERSPDVAYFLRADLRMDRLRSDPRFQDLMQRMNFPQ
jgi:TolB-like protein/DNA-binding winged helix-turn-helix (wHTH) protein/Tfp pilus assembly protein PilF